MFVCNIIHAVDWTERERERERGGGERENYSEHGRERGGG